MLKIAILCDCQCITIFDFGAREICFCSQLSGAWLLRQIGVSLLNELVVSLFQSNIWKIFEKYMLHC